MNLKSGVVVLIMFFSTSLFAGFMPVANITKIQGEVLNNKEKLKTGDEVFEGMTLKADKGIVEFKFQNGHLVRLVGGSLKVATINPKNADLELLKGEIFAKILPMTTDEAFALKTDKATFSLSGSSVHLEKRNKSTSFIVIDGAAEAKNDKAASVKINKGEILTIVKKDQELKPIAALQKKLEKLNGVLLKMH